MKKRREAKENLLLEKAIVCMEQVDKGRDKDSDDDDLFGQFIASEIQSIRDPYIKRQLKWDIQSAIHEAHNAILSRQSPASWAGESFENQLPKMPLSSFSQLWNKKMISPTPSCMSHSLSPSPTYHD